MADVSEGLARRTFLGGVLALPAFATLLAAKAGADASKAPQSAMHYQTSPNGSMQCSQCRYFVPGPDAKSDGSCQVVDGSISPNGYCIAYSAKSA
jgi:hypothetical protein